MWEQERIFFFALHGTRGWVRNIVEVEEKERRRWKNRSKRAKRKPTFFFFFFSPCVSEIGLCLLARKGGGEPKKIFFSLLPLRSRLLRPTKARSWGKEQKRKGQKMNLRRIIICRTFDDHLVAFPQKGDNYGMNIFLGSDKTQLLIPSPTLSFPLFSCED